MNPDEIHNESDNLNSIPNDGGFTVPEGYFEDLKAKLLIRTQKGFETPDGYFAQAKSNILQATVGQEKSKIVPLYKKPWIQYAVAASVLFVMGIIFWPSGPNPQQMASLNEVSDTEIMSYMETTNLHDLPVSEISPLIQNVSLTIEENYIINESDAPDLLEEL